MNILHKTLLTLAFVIALPLAAWAQDVGGTYTGTYTASQVPGEISITIVFRQDGNTITSQYHTASGVDGVGYSILYGNVAKMSFHNTTSSCPGTYQGVYTFTDTNVTWTYSGNDCLGAEEGKGTATKQNDM